MPLVAAPSSAAADAPVESPTPAAEPTPPAPERAPTPPRVLEADVVLVTDRAEDRSNPVPFSNITRQTLEERGAFKDVPTLLSESPSVMWYSENGNGIGYNYLTIRGFDQRRISVMVDGVPQNDPEDHNVYWVNVYDLAGSLEDVQVQRGGGAAFYGPPAIGGAINMVTRRFSATPYGKAELGLGLYEPSFPGALLSAQRYTAELGTGELGAGVLRDRRVVVYGRFSHLRSEGYRDWSWSRYWRGFLGAEVRAPRSSLRLQAYGGPQRDALAYYGIPKDYNDDADLRRTNWSAGTDVEAFAQTHYDAIHTWNPTDRLVVTNTLFYLRGDGYFDFAGYWADPDYLRLPEALPAELVSLYYPPADDPDAPPAEGIPADTILRAQVTNNEVGWLPRVVYAHGRGEHIAGAELRWHRSEHWGRVEAGTFPTDVAPYVVGEGAGHRYYAYGGGKDVVSGYLGERLVQGDLTIDTNAQLVLQRYLIEDEAWVGTSFVVPYTFLNPRLGANYNVGPRLNVWSATSRTRREPRLKNLYDADEASWGTAPAFFPGEDGQPDFGRPLVVPETLIDSEVGLGWGGARVRAKGGLFVMRFEDEIVPTGGVDVYNQPRTGNADRSIHAGVELEGAVALGAGLMASANGTFSRNRFESLSGALGLPGLEAAGEVAFLEYCEDDSVSEAVPVDRTGNPIAGFPDALGTVKLDWRREDLRLGLVGRLVGRQYTDNSADTRCDGSAAGGAKVVDPYGLVGLSAGYEVPRARLSLSLDVDNLLNQEVLLAGFGEEFYPAASRAWYVRVSRRF